MTAPRSSQSSPPSPPVLVADAAEHVRVLTLDRPERRNAVDPPMLAALDAAVRDAAGDPDVRALVLTGTGPSFCAGAAVDVLRDAHEMDRADDTGPVVISTLVGLGKPSFAAVTGHAYGLGMGLALACDFRIAGRGARFNSAFIRHGLVPGDGSGWTLTRLVGPSRSLWMHLFAETVDAAEALRIGLVDQVVDDDEAVRTAVARASALAAGPPVATRLITQMVRAGEHVGLPEHLAAAARAQRLVREGDA